MLKFLPLLLMLAYGYAMYRFSAWRTLKTLDAQSRPLDEPGLAEMTGKMAKALDLPQVKVNVYEIPGVNGLAAPDGRIFLTRGFVEKYRQGVVSAEELASVIAHELGHVALGHSKRRMIDFTGANALGMLLMATLGRFVPGIGPVLVRAVTGALTAHLSRSDEHEADAYASALLVKAGIGTRPQKTMFRKLGALTGSAGLPGGAPAWLASHPPVEDRIRRIEEREARWSVKG